LAIFVRASDQRLLVFLRNGPLSAGTGILTASASEWRPFPTIEDAPTSTHISGSTTSRIANRLDATQPVGTTGQAACTCIHGRADTGWFSEHVRQCCE
jgi:hypothetical protein